MKKGIAVSVLMQSLASLEHAISRLEQAVESAEDSLVGQQRDMFAAPAGPPRPQKNGKGVQAAMIVRRLDHAIEKAEQLLAQR